MRRRSGARALVALALAVAGHAADTQAQQSPPPPATAPATIEASRLADGETHVIDGVLDEPAWSRAMPAANFMQRDPDTGAPATERTEVRVVVDSTRLILGVTCFDSEPQRLLGNQMQRDQPFSGDDRFMWGLDTYLDGRTGYFFEINPAGAMGDGLVTGPGGGGQFGAQMNKSWDGIWIARVRRTNVGWTAEIEIPFRTLNLNPNSDAWGVNFQRTVRRKNEESLWTGWQRTEGLLRMSNAGRLTGIGKVSQGLGLDVKPYAVASASNAPGRGAPATIGTRDVGLDVFYNLTPALRANFTVNTDFAETEVDQRQTNLTRFPLFFPERREFFLEGSSFFEFPLDDASPFFSRRIGLTDGQPQRILFGGKLTGQIGKQDVGALHVRTGTDDGPPGTGTRLASEDFSALRLKRRFGRQSSAGVVYTRRAPADASSALDDRHTLGGDITLSTPSFLGNRNLETGAWFLHTTGLPGMPGPTNAYGGVARYNNDPVNVELDVREFGRAYDAAVGFTPRRNFRRWNPELGYTPRINRGWVRELGFEANAEIVTLPDNSLITRDFSLTPLEVLFENGNRLQFQIFQVTEQLEIDFEISDGITLPLGSRYAWRRQQVEFDSAQNRRVSARAEYSFGNFYSGDRRELNIDLRLRPRAGVFIQASSEYNDVRLAEGAFITRLYRLDARTQFSPWLALSNNVQYDTQSGQLGWQMRFRWIRRPGNDLYAVYTHNWRDDLRLSTLDRRAAVKIVQTFRF